MKRIYRIETRVFMGCLRHFTGKQGGAYSTLAGFSGVLAHLQHEFEHRVLRPYEDHKVMDNGDIPEFEW